MDPDVGQRDARSRIAHLLLEILTRLRLIDRVKDNSFRLPMTQTQLGEAVGLTSVHVNRRPDRNERWNGNHQTGGKAFLLCAKHNTPRGGD
jgi:hypothetical protein